MTSTVTHGMYIGPPCFPVFNERDLGAEPVERGDVVPFQRSDSAGMRFAASAAWSSNCEWYFVILSEGIALFNVFARTGLLCKRHTSAFIGECLKSGDVECGLYCEPEPAGRALLASNEGKEG